MRRHRERARGSIEQMARNWLAANGVEPTPRAWAGACDIVEAREEIRAFLSGLNGGS